MSALKPSVEAERLRLVQHAARRALGLKKGFRGMELFDSSTGASDYSWRSQLAWTWAKAGYLSSKITGKGLNKHSIYSLSSLGTIALERIASDQLVAAFYTNAKRSMKSEQSPADWFRPPQLAMLTTVISVGIENAEDDGDDEEGGEEEIEGKDLSVSESEARESAVPKDIAFYFERSTTAIEALAGRLASLDSRIGALEREQKTQLEIFLEGMQKLEEIGSQRNRLPAPAPREDLSDKIRVVLGVVEQSQMTSKSDVEVLKREIAFLRNEVGDLGASITLVSAEVSEVQKLASSSNAFAGAIASRIESISPDLVGAKAAVDSMTAEVADVRSEIEYARDESSSLADNIENLNQKFDENASLFRKQVSLIHEGVLRASASAEELLSAAKVVSQEMFAVAAERAGIGGGPKAAKLRSEAAMAAIGRFERAESKIHSSASALGAGLIRAADAARPLSPEPDPDEESHDDS